jgi:multidrug efflux pump subunit AcrB
MGLTNLCLRNPAAVAVAVALLLLLGAVSVTKLPVQLFPDIARPQISIQASWRAASSEEVESEIVEPLEEVLQGIPGLVRMESWSNAGFAWINLTFSLSTDMQATRDEVITRLSRIPNWPDDADPPRPQWGGGQEADSTLIFLFVQALPGNGKHILEYQRFIEDVVTPRLEAVPGVAGVEVGGGGPGLAPQQVQIIFDPFRAADFGIDITEVAAAIGQSGNASGGFTDVGRRQYMLQFQGRFTPENLSELIIEWRDGRPVRLGDIADIRVERGRRNNFSYQNGNPAIGLRVLRESNANVLATLEQVTKVLEELRAGPMKEQGLDIQKSFDPSVFIVRAISLLTGNLFIGILLAVGVLWLFLRQARATLLIATAIPICLLTTFIVLQLTGRSLNVISLAGLAFAVGMVLDAAIVVLENIVRLREKGMDAEQAASEGTGQVWGALVASTATTVAIFAPIIFLRDVEGQLFADLALTIAIAVTVSLFAAVTILPTAARHYVKTVPNADGNGRTWRAAASVIMRMTDTPGRRRLWIAGLTGGSVAVALALWLMSTMNYLPPVKRDAVDVFFMLPDGVTLDVVEEEIAKPIMERMAPLMAGTREPALKNYYFIGWNGGGTIGARVKDQSRVKELEKLMRDEILAGFPDTQAFAAQGDLFGNFEGGGSSVLMLLQSSDRETLEAAALTAMNRLREVLPENARIRAQPQPGAGQPELKITPDDRRIQESRWTRRQIGTLVRALGNGLYVGEYFDGEKRLDIILRGPEWTNPDELAALPVATPSGAIVPLGELVKVERTVGPANIRRVDRRRSIGLLIAADDMPLQKLIETVEREVEPVVRPAMPADGNIRYGGNADQLRQAQATLGENFLIALLLLFLLMAALFRSLKDSLLAFISIPLAMVGGLVGLRLMDLVTPTPLDLLGIVGFFILMGLVVNNAILLVHRTRQGEAEGQSRRMAVEEALRVRLRPILMSTLTSLFGMLPLVLIPGVGSAIYRGLATVIAGGMAVSMIFTLVLLPSLLRLGEARRRVPAPVAAQ